MLITSPFARNLSLRIAVASSVLLFSVLMIVTTIEVSNTIKNCAANLDEKLELCAGNIDSEFDAIQTSVENITLMIDNLPADSITYKNTLTELLKCNPYFYDIYVYLNPATSLKTGLICPIVERLNGGDSLVFKPAILPKWNEESVKCVFQTSQITAEIHPWYGPCYESVLGIYILGYVAVSPKVSTGEGCVVGIDADIRSLVKSLRSLKLYPGSITYVVDNYNHLVCDSEHDMPTSFDYSDDNSLGDWWLNYSDNILSRDFDIGDYLTSYIELDDNGHITDKSGFIRDIFKKNDTRIVRKAVLNNGWTLYVACPRKEVFADTILTLSIMGLAMLFSIILLFFFCTGIIVKMARPLKQFAIATNSIAKGNFDAELPVLKGNDEISQLRDSFDRMQVSLKEYILELKETTAEKERMLSELHIASDIQNQNLRKDFPCSDRFDLYAAMHAAKEVGGDIYDYIQKGNKLYICIGDVSGKGVPAALLMMKVTTLFRQISTASERTLSDMASIINNCLSYGNDNLFFVTFFVGCINLDTLQMEYCNCGHNPIMIISPDGKASFKEVIPNRALGIVWNQRYKQESIQLDKGSRVILYTDGVNEAKNVSNEKYGNHRLLGWANNASAYNEEKSLVESLFTELRVFSMGANQSDDITMLSVHIK